MKIFFDDERGHRRTESFDAFVFPIASTLRYADKKLNGYFERFGKAAIDSLLRVADVRRTCFAPIVLGQSVLVPVSHPDFCKDLIPDACEFWLHILNLLAKLGCHRVEVHPVLWLAGLKIGDELECLAKAADLSSCDAEYEACAVIPSTEKIILNAASVAQIMKKSSLECCNIAQTIASVMEQGRKNLYLHVLGHSEFQN